MNVCKTCGTTANALTCLNKYGELPKKVAFDVSTFHLDECDFCGVLAWVTEDRDFFYPDFSLIGVKMKNRLKAGNKFRYASLNRITVIKEKDS